FLLVLLQGIAAGQETEAILLTKGEKATEAAYKRGVAEAEKELKEDRATIYEYGMRSTWLTEHMNRRTGLPYKAIAGCEGDGESLAVAEAHNKPIDDYIAKQGLPANSFKPWDKDLFALRAFHESRSKTAPPQRPALNGPALRSPDGRHAVRLIRTHF